MPTEFFRSLLGAVEHVAGVVAANRIPPTPIVKAATSIVSLFVTGGNDPLGDSVTLCGLDPTPVEEETVEAGVKHRKRLAGAGRRGNQDISTRLNGRPSLRLDIHGLANLPVKPFSNERMEASGMARDRTTPPDEALAARAEPGCRCRRVPPVKR